MASSRALLTQHPIPDSHRRLFQMVAFFWALASNEDIRGGGECCVLMPGLSAANPRAWVGSSTCKKL
jgi:hypothetical protein